MNTVVATLIVSALLSAGVSANARSGLMCQALFQNETKETRFSFVPEHIRLTRTPHATYFADYVFRINNSSRLRSTELAMDSENVINANLQSGREFLNAILSKSKHDKPNGAFIFIDVNNLGWVNKNFHDKMQAGDLYIQKTVEAIQSVVADKGLVFRLGGDEFGIVLETKSPEVIQKTMQNLQREIHAKAHSVFLSETKRRVADFKVMHQRYKNNEISEAEYQSRLAEFRTYTQYSQEGVSMGMAYIVGGLPSVIQQRAEAMAVEMKIKIKTAFNLDTSKYTGGVNLSQVNHKIKPSFRPGIPMVMSPSDFTKVYPQAHTADTLIVKDRSMWFAAVPVMQVKRTHEVFRLGQIGIGKYKNELNADEYHAEYYDNSGKPTGETRPIEMNTVTGLMDARAPGAKTVINYFLGQSDKLDANNAVMWVSLLNLGKLNYFHRKTETGDLALALAAKAIQSELIGKHVPFKHNGSDFYILTTGITKQEMNEHKKNLEAKLNANPLLDQIFLQEIEYIKRTEADSGDRQKKIDEIYKLMAKKYQVF